MRDARVSEQLRAFGTFQTRLHSHYVTVCAGLLNTLKNFVAERATRGNSEESRAGVVMLIQIVVMLIQIVRIN